VKHLHGCGLIAGTSRQEAAQLLPALVLGCGMLRGLQVLRATVRGDESGEIRELLCRQRDEIDRTGSARSDA
jgi:hypothetical protein